MTNRNTSLPLAALRTSLASAALLLAGVVALAAATDGFQAFTTEAARRVAVRRLAGGRQDRRTPPSR